MFSLGRYKNQKLKKSIFGHFVQNHLAACAYNSLKVETIYFDYKFLPYLLATTEKKLADVIRDIPVTLRPHFTDLLEKICTAHILVPQGYDELTYLGKVRQIAFNGPHIRVLVLHLTDFCNLRCHYCFIEGNIPSGYLRQDMTEQVIEAAINKFGQVIADKKFLKPPSVVFYGGEPLANWKILKAGLEYLVKRQQEGYLPAKLDKIIITNGTLITTAMAQIIKNHRVMVSISIDGPEEIHDHNRIFRNGVGSFAKVIEGFWNLKKAGVNPTVSCVLGKESTTKAKEIIRWLLDCLGIKALGFNHVSIVPDLNSYDPVYEVEFGRALLEVQEIIQAEYPLVYERRMNHKINNFLERQILLADCTGCGEQMSISPDGFIGICQGYMGSRKTFKAKVSDRHFDPSQDEVFREWSRRSPLNMPQCYDCIALSTCGGGCPRNADYINGSIWEKDSAFCHFAKQAQEWMIWKKYKAEM